MKAKTYFFRLLITLLTFLFGIGVYAVWFNLQANTNTHQSNVASPQIELVPSIAETDNSSNKFEAVCCFKQLTGNVTVNVKRFVSKKGDKCYQYTVKNNTNQEIRGVDIGIDPNTDSTELNTLPKGWSVDEINGGTVEVPNSNSMVEAYLQEESDQIYITTKGRTFLVDAGKTGSFYVCMESKWDSTYQTSHWKAFMEHENFDLTGKLINLDSK
jgi:hypothetical protein